MKRWVFWVVLVCVAAVMAVVVIKLHEKNRRVAGSYLIYAVNKGSYESAVDWLQRGADPNWLDLEGMTALHHAVRGNKREMVELLLAEGGDTNVRDKRGETALYYAANLHAADEQNEMMAILINAGAKYSLYYAVLFGDTDGLIGLLDKGADADERTPYEGRVLHAAVRQGTVEMVRALIEAGVDVNAKVADATRKNHHRVKNPGWTPLHFAASRGDVDIASLLIEAGADTNVRTTRKTEENRYWVTLPGWMPIHLAARQEDSEVISLLINAGADVNVRIDEGGDTRYQSNYDSWTPLHLAIGKRNPEAVKLLISAGADVNTRVEVSKGFVERAKSGCSPLHLAITSWKPEIVELLIDAGADVNARIPDDGYHSGHTPLHLAASMNNADIIQVLLEHSADPNGLSLLSGENGKFPKTPLDHIDRRVPSDHDSIKLLVQAGGKKSRELTNIWGKSLLHEWLSSEDVESIRHASLCITDSGGPELPDSAPDKLEEWQKHADKLIIWLGTLDKEKAGEIEAVFSSYISRLFPFHSD